MTMALSVKDNRQTDGAKLCPPVSLSLRVINNVFDVLGL